MVASVWMVYNVASCGCVAVNVVVHVVVLLCTVALRVGSQGRAVDVILLLLSYITCSLCSVCSCHMSGVLCEMCCFRCVVLYIVYYVLHVC